MSDNGLLLGTLCVNILSPVCGILGGRIGGPGRGVSLGTEFEVSKDSHHSQRALCLPLVDQDAAVSSSCQHALALGS